MEKNYSEILQVLNDGYTVEQLPDLGIQQSTIKDFTQYLEETGLTVENAKALNMYSYNSDIILAVKNDTKSIYEMQCQLRDNAAELLEQRGLTTPQINKSLGFIEDADYTRPLHENFTAAKEFFAEHEIPKSALPTVNTAIKGMDTLYRTDDIISEIDDALSKSTLKEPSELYRAIKIPDADSSNVLDKLETTSTGYTSTSPSYESSFAKYEDNNVVLKMNAPEGTQAINMEPFSDYGSVEGEILLGPNTMNISNISDITDAAGMDKIMIEAAVANFIPEESIDMDISGLEV